jgi:hypothetical protein
LISFGFEIVLPEVAVSSPSSNVVALVEQEPWAEELLLWAGEASRSRASELRIDFPSPLPLSNEGVFELRKLLVVPVLNRDPLFAFPLPAGVGT